MNDNNTNFEIIRSGRKTIALEITRDLRVLVRAPYRMPDRDIKRFIEEKSLWLEKHMKLMKKKVEMAQQQKESAPKFTSEEIHQLADKALVIIPERVAYYAPIVGVRFGRITIRNQVSRWGSCSNKGNLNFNCLLMLMPPDVIDYVVVHELCHLKELNHSPKFWNEVGRVLPDYKVSKKWLKDNGTALIQRLR
ncbi:MAG: SprT family zinc-dependent metalloprotease [Oscillospiraceae bacterium]|nr:SprT family zinc-dependent metalloprotease [Oscillospiraceae bacterium]MDD4413053.1 SprT family zinc-dependent metalloprotease [Oscillospiraceae bacterium]